MVMTINTNRVVIVTLLGVLAGCVDSEPDRPKVLVCNPRQPTVDDVQFLRARLSQARSAVWSLPESEQGRVLALIAKADMAVNRFEAKARRGGCGQGKTGLLLLAGAATVADDVTVVGVANDVLLPIIAIGLIAEAMRNTSPAPPAELQDSWLGVISSMEAVGKAAESVRASRRVSPMPPDNDCRSHVNACLLTRLGAKNSGGAGRSICEVCLRICEGQGKWPVRTGHGKDCRWWLH